MSVFRFAMGFERSVSGLAIFALLLSWALFQAQSAQAESSAKAVKTALTEKAVSTAQEVVKAVASDTAAQAEKTVATATAAPADKAASAETTAKAEVSPSEAAGADPLKAPGADISYCVGLDIGGSLKDIPATLDLDLVIRGIRDQLEGRPHLLDEGQVMSIKREFSAKIQQERAKKMETAAADNKAIGAKFLEGNKARKGVVTTASGLQYEVVKEGAGAAPKATDTVKVHYRGTLIDGKEFDSSHSRGEPATFPVNRVIPGWTEALQLMKVGGVSKLFIPSELAYGERGAGQDIGPNSTLIFEVELLGIE